MRGKRAAVFLVVVAALTAGCDNGPGTSRVQIQNCGTMHDESSYAAGFKRANQCMQAAWRAHRAAQFVFPGTDVEGNDARVTFRVRPDQTVTYSYAGGPQIRCSTRVWLRTGSCRSERLPKPPRITPTPRGPVANGSDCSPVACRERGGSAHGSTDGRG